MGRKSRPWCSHMRRPVIGTVGNISATGLRVEVSLIVVINSVANDQTLMVVEGDNARALLGLLVANPTFSSYTNHEPLGRCCSLPPGAGSWALLCRRPLLSLAT